MRRTKEDAEQTKKDILAAATRLFAEKSVARTTLDDIAKAAHVTRGAIYWHFKNKTEIFDALHEELHRPVLDVILEGLEKDHPEPLLQLQELCIHLFRELEHDEQRKQALTLFLVKCDYAGDLAAYKDKHSRKKAEKQKAFARYFEKAKEKGKLPPDADAELLTQAFHCYLKGMLFEYLDNPSGFDMQNRAPKLVKLFFTNIAGAPVPA